ncbi:lipopolysaccharide assembly protein LapB [Moraxella sp. ZY210820]|uniref:tetratricopeptide repeat protein n=1 Tax=unclassified Moraxella TaxID=2685852 RepID=UPI002731D1F1|nr:tetratricopeptide repeat protein [Moraxella sp. ZY210820]WLF85031.1 tetratricopeptide repeat protein [Moraxella sp. ZY210820]
MTPEQENELNAQIAEWEKVTREKDGDKAYAQAQSNLGINYHQKGNIDKAIEYYLNIKREYDALIYAESQWNLSIAYHQKGEIDKEIECYLNIKHEDNASIYAHTQFNLGVTYGEKGNFDKEIECYLNIKREDNVSIYAKAQLYLAITYKQEGNIDKAIEYYLNIKYEDNASIYVHAQLDLGVIYWQKDNINQAIECYLNIKREYDSIQYAKAQFNLGILYLKENKQKIAEKYLNESYRTKPDFKNFILTKIIEFTQYQDFFGLFGCMLSIQNQLQIHFNDEFERKLAHYTNINVVRIFLDKDKHINGVTGLLRLNKIYDMNDPTEGNILFKYLNTELCLDDEYGNMQYSPFIACFTLNHDNLNQFRLYGKTNQQEATGISLVFGQDFFSLNNDGLFSNIKVFNKLNASQDDKKPNEKLPIYRCIYIDPETGYIRLAQRDKMTFYREFADEKSETVIEKLWKKYKKNIQTKEKEIKTLLGYIKELIQNILNNVKGKKKKEALELVSLILLPLQYLVKHSAFQEEQECRICDITSLNDTRIQTDFDKKWLYIDYPEPVKRHIKNVYIATGAKEYYPFIVRLLGEEDSASKVQLSKNPFRTA